MHYVNVCDVFSLDRSIYSYHVNGCVQFGTEDQVNCDKLDKWLLKHCPNMFSGVHSWVCMVLGGGNLPAEMVRKGRMVSVNHC